jgi:hypothetical protein
MPDEIDHAACVDAWLERAARGLSPERLLQLFEASLGALWAHTKITLGEVTLTAIVDRVLYNTAEKFPLLSPLVVEPNGGVQFQELRARAGAPDQVELEAGIRFVLVEFLRVLGNLTADILTPELHAELSKVALGDDADAGSEAPGTAFMREQSASEDKPS